jgi:hypothetical protein
MPEWSSAAVSITSLSLLDTITPYTMGFSDLRWPVHLRRT